MKLDTATGIVERLEVAAAFEQGPDGYADTNRPVLNKHGSFYGGLYWKVMATTYSEADSNNYKPSN